MSLHILIYSKLFKKNLQSAFDLVKVLIHIYIWEVPWTSIQSLLVICHDDTFNKGKCGRPGNNLYIFLL